MDYIMADRIWLKASLGDPILGDSDMLPGK